VGGDLVHCGGDLVYPPLPYLAGNPQGKGEGARGRCEANSLILSESYG
jgi:hypothetical protein